MHFHIEFANGRRLISLAVIRFEAPVLIDVIGQANLRCRLTAELAVVFNANGWDEQQAVVDLPQVFHVAGIRIDFVTGYVLIEADGRTGQAGPFVFELAVFAAKSQVMMVADIHRIPGFGHPGAVIGFIHVSLRIHAA